jgi:acetolactate synthase regulatory subunit
MERSFQLELELVAGKPDAFPRVIAICHQCACRVVSVDYDERVSNRLVVVVKSLHRTGHMLSLKLNNSVDVMTVRSCEIESLHPARTSRQYT